jgi:effector-binding domain-containing protein
MSLDSSGSLTFMSTETSNEPSIVERSEQPYVAIKRSVTMGSFAEIADRLPDVFAWLAARAIAPAGPPFFKYNVIDMERELEVEAGVPTDTVVAGAGEIFSATLPAGRYATTTHVGHPDELMGVTAELLSWGPHRWVFVWGALPRSDVGQRRQSSR